MADIPDDLVLGRGKLFFAPYPFGEKSGGVKAFFGNVPSVQIAQATTQLDHYDSTRGLKVKNRSVVLQSDQTLTFTCDNMTPGNLALWFGGNDNDDLPSDAPSDMGSAVVIGRMTSIYGGLFFKSDNPEGVNKNYWWPYVNLRPNGNIDLIGDTWQTMGFVAEALKRDRSTERVYVFETTDGATVADTDTSSEFTPDSASVPGDVFATTATLTASTPQVHAVPFNVVYSLNAGTGGEDLLAYLFVNNGTVVLNTLTEAVGSAGTVSMAVASAATVTIKAYDNVLGTGTPLGTTANVVVT